MVVRPVVEDRAGLKLFYQALTSNIHTQIQIELLNNRPTKSYLNYNNQLITPRKVGIASNLINVHPHTHKYQPLSSSTENVYRRLLYARQHIHSTHS